MSGSITLDDKFVLQKLTSIATGRPALIDLEATRMWLMPGRIEDGIEQCLKLFDEHRGINSASAIPDEYQDERLFLNYGLGIVGKVLNFENFIPTFKSVIEIDWKAHIELKKEKRYRDHISHPVRVTAIGWWLLHRNNNALLTELADHYKDKTYAYREAFAIETRPHEWKDIVEYAWLACGLLHDAAYPLEYQLRTGEKLRMRYGDTLRIFNPARKRFTTTRMRQTLLKQLTGSWFANQGLDLDTRMSESVSGGKFKHAHALLGPLHYLLTFDMARLHSLQGLILQLAARAIMTHHDDEDEFIVSDPLALLLYVADNLQAWQRPFMHREGPAIPLTNRCVIRPIVECERIELIPQGTGYLAKFCMNNSDKEILIKDPYNWKFEKFREPNERVERLISKHGTFPLISLSQHRCIQPEEFLRFMQGSSD